MSNCPDRNKALQRIRDRIQRSVDNPRPSLSTEEVGDHLDAILTGEFKLSEGHEFEKWLREEIASRYAELKADPAKAISVADSRARFERRHAAEMARANKG